MRKEESAGSADILSALECAPQEEHTPLFSSGASIAVHAPGTLVRSRQDVGAPRTAAVQKCLASFRKESVKFLGQRQSCYPKKNWSSVMLFNCSRCKALTPDYVQTATGLDLHRFNWLSENLVGSLPGRWNHLVDYDPPLPIDAVSLLHFTSGGPWFQDYRNCGYAEHWQREYQSLAL